MKKHLARREWVSISIITLAAGALRLIALGSKSFWLDELSSIGICAAPSGVFKNWVLHREGNMALYYLLLRVWIRLGTSETRVRLLSAIAGIAAVPLMYLLARRLLRSESAWIATVLLALSPGATIYSQEARAYSLLVLAVLASTFAFVSLIERPSWIAAVGYGVLAAVMMYCHFFGALMIAAQLVSLLALPMRRTPWKQLLLAIGILALLAWPVMWMMRTQDPAHLDWVLAPSLLELYHLGIFLAAESGKALAAIMLVLELGIVLLFLRHCFERWRQSNAADWRSVLVISGFAVPIVISLVVSAVRPVFFHRFLIICLPFWLLMVAGGLDKIRSRVAARSTLAIILGLSLVVVAGSYTKSREDWRGATYYLLQNMQPDDRLICYRDYGCDALNTYATIVMGKSRGFLQGTIAGLETDTAESGQVWLVRYPSTQDDATMRQIMRHLQQHYTQTRQAQFQNIFISSYRQK